MPFGLELPCFFERAQGPLNLGAVLLTERDSEPDDHTPPVSNLATQEPEERVHGVLDPVDERLARHELTSEYAGRAAEWLPAGQLVSRETFVDGIENAVDAFLGLLRGDNTGKMVVRL